MTTLVFEPISDTVAYVEIGGDSTDTKPSTVSGYTPAPTSIFTEADTGIVSFWSDKESDWVEQFTFKTLTD